MSLNGVVDLVGDYRHYVLDELDSSRRFSIRAEAE